MTDHRLAALAVILLFTIMVVCPVMGYGDHSEDTTGAKSAAPAAFYPSEPVCLSEDAPDLNAEILPPNKVKIILAWGDPIWDSPWDDKILSEILADTNTIYYGPWSEEASCDKILNCSQVLAYIPEIMIGSSIYPAHTVPALQCP